MGRCFGLNISTPDSLCSIYMTCQSSRQKATVCAGPYDFIVTLCVSVCSAGVADAKAFSARVLIAGIIRFSVQCRSWILGFEYFSEIPIIVVFAFVAYLMQCHPGTIAPVFERGRVGICR